MAEPSAIWSNRLVVFDKSISLTQNVILSHARAALQALISRIDNLHTQVAAFPQLIDFYPHPEIPSTLTDIASQQAIASAILFNDSHRTTREREDEYQLRMKRVLYVKALCTQIETAILSNKSVRNRLTHIDEHLAREMKRPNTGWIIDSAIARRDQFAAPDGLATAFCRTYIASEGVIAHLGHDISVAGLRQEANRVLGAVWGEPPH
jgi:hypothetical protein